jgi:uncharacterized membrane protein
MSGGRERAVGSAPRFRDRGEGISRLEGFTDCAFGFAITLLVVSLEVPRSFDGLLAVLKGFPGFAFSFAILCWIWYSHYRFFRRYGLQDNTTILLNLLLLFVVLFYVYPLKFLYALVGGGASQVSDQQVPLLFVIYGLGFAAVYAVFVLLYANAYRQRAQLQLEPHEITETRLTMEEFAGVAAVGLVSAGVALLPVPAGLAGFCYLAIALPYWLVGRRRRHLAKKARA